MSSSASLTERTVTAVLLALWRRPETTLDHLLRETLAPLPHVQEALRILADRKCLIEQMPTELRLVSTGLACWRDILEDEARRNAWRVARRVAIYACTSSTNDVAWACGEPGNPECDGLAVLADEQTAGRGRLGHHWLAKPEQAILLSLRIHPPPLPSPPSADDSAGIERLTLLAGLAVARTIDLVCGRRFTAQIKWPNDVQVGGRKIAGVLVERRGARPSPAASSSALVIGIGVNVAQSAADFPPDIAPRATSIYQTLGHAVDRLRVAVTLLSELNRVLLIDTAGDAEQAWLADWKSRCAMLGKTCTARVQNHPITGQIVDIDPLHGLALRDEYGTLHFLSAQTATLDPGP